MEGFGIGWKLDSQKRTRTMTERRAYFRTGLQTEAWITDSLDEAWKPVKLLDIAVEGVAFISNEPLATGMLRMFHFNLPGNPMRMHVTVKIKHRTKHAFLAGFRIGAAFIKIGEGDVALIKRFVENHPLSSQQ
jgi:hypothetical protein